MIIKLQKHDEIDIHKWNVAIENASNRLVYAQSWYLDIVSPQWEALITENYSLVMPLPVKHKLFLAYLIQPRFTQQLGVFAKGNITPALVTSFLEAIPRKFFWCDINLNYANVCEFSKNIIFQDNFELNLNASYDFIWSGFNRSTRQNIKKAARLKLRVEETPDYQLFMNVYFAHCKVKPDKTGIIQLTRIAKHSVNAGIAKTYLVKDTKGTILAGAFYLGSFNRLINMVSFTTHEGRNKSAMFLLVDHVIQCHLNKPVILDFEGSTIPGIAEFFRGFGGKCIAYPRLKKRLL